MNVMRTVGNSVNASIGVWEPWSDDENASVRLSVDGALDAAAISALEARAIAAMLIVAADQADAANARKKAGAK